MKKYKVLIPVIAIATLIGCNQKVETPTNGVAVLTAMNETNTVGTIVFKQTKQNLHITGSVENITPGKHGFHIHQFGDLRSSTGKTAGGHYNPHEKKHGDHSGDLGNIIADESGVAIVDVTISTMSINDILGRSIVVHANADDLISQPSGAAGKRIGVGVIGIKQP